MAVKLTLIFVLVISSIEYSQVSVNMPSIERQVGAADEYINIVAGNISGQDSVTSFQFTIFYDNSIIYLTDVTATGSNFSGLSWDPIFNADTSNGKMSVAWASPYSISGSGILVKVKVHYLEQGTTPLTFINPQNSKNTFLFNGGKPSAITTDGSIILKSTTSVDTVILNKRSIDFQLFQNFPNPFNPVTYINYSLSQSGNVTLAIYNIIGQEITKLVNGVKNAGLHKVIWDASNLSSGIYFYKIDFEGTSKKYSETKRMVLLK